MRGSHARPTAPPPYRCTRSAATACRRSRARWSARAAPARRRASRLAAATSRTCSTTPETGASRERASSRFTRRERPPTPMRAASPSSRAPSSGAPTTTGSSPTRPSRACADSCCGPPLALARPAQRTSGRGRASPTSCGLRRHAAEARPAVPAAAEQAPTACCSSARTRASRTRAPAPRCCWRPRAQLLRQPFVELVEIDKAVDTASALLALKAGQRLTRSFRLRRPKGAPLEVEISARRLADGRLQLALRNIGERRRAAEALRESEERYERLATAARTRS